MWLFKQKAETIEQIGLLSGITDWHSHVLPGVDDGIKTMEESLAVLSHFESLGVGTLWLTPHVMEDYPNKTEDLKKRFEQLKKEWNGDVRIRLAAEYMLDSLFEERLKTRDLLPIGNGADHLLVETSYFSAPIDFDRMIDSIMSAGYFVVLAHPERYTYMNEKDYARLRERGVKMQLNYVSLVGGYGETAKKKTIWLLQNGCVDIVGSDLHRLASNQTLIGKTPDKKEQIEMLQKVVASKNTL